MSTIIIIMKTHTIYISISRALASFIQYCLPSNTLRCFSLNISPLVWMHLWDGWLAGWSDDDLVQLYLGAGICMRLLLVACYAMVVVIFLLGDDHSIRDQFPLTVHLHSTGATTSVRLFSVRPSWSLGVCLGCLKSIPIPGLHRSSTIINTA